MGGGNLEIFKFALYLGIPLFAMVHFGDPDWYENHVYPMKQKLWPVPYEQTHKPPKTQPELQAELQRLRNERLGKVSDAAPSPVLASLPERSPEFNWAAGDKRLV